MSNRQWELELAMNKKFTCKFKYDMAIFDTY